MADYWEKERHEIEGRLIKMINTYIDANKLFDAGDYKKAAELFKSICEPQTASDQYNWGVMYYHGKGVPQSYIDAAYWFNIAEKNGEKNAAYALALQFLNGQGVEKNTKIALELLQKASDKGCNGARLVLAGILLYGTYGDNEEIIIEEHPKEGFELFFQVASFSEPENRRVAEYEVGCCYYYGKGTEKDLLEAKKWFEKSFDDDYDDAKKALLKVEEEINNQNTSET